MTDTNTKPTRRIIICCDGSWQASDKAEETANINVTKLAEAVATSAKLDDGTVVPQIVYYQAGVASGSAGNERWYNRTFNKVHNAFQGFAGFGLAENVVEAYHFLVANYEEGAELFFFGFSRGAYTARALAGMVHELGVLDRPSARSFPKIYENYRKLSPADWPSYKAMEMAKEGLFAHQPRVKVLGCWDTVGALGIPEYWIVKQLDWNRQYKFHRAELCTNVDNAFHALALDEHRGTHTPALWHLPPASRTHLVQCWFPGFHISVGGGTDAGKASHHDQLALTSLSWMLAMCAPFLKYEDTFFEREFAQVKNDWVKGDLWKYQVPDSYSWFLNWYSVRTPGQYGPQNVVDLKRAANSDTFEFMHACVRVRYQDAPVLPPVLHGWKLRKGEKRDATAQHSGWEWFKNLPDGQELVIPEMMYLKEEALDRDVKQSDSVMLQTLLDGPRK